MSKSKKPIQSQVLELLGRSLYVCNVIELRLRWMHKHSGGIWTGKTPEELLKSINNAVEKQQKDDKRMLGLVGQEILDSIYTPRSNKDIEDAEKKSLFAFKLDFKIQSKGRLRRAKAKFKKFVDIRNYLVHYFARDFNLMDLESCKKALVELKAKCKIIKDAADFFESDYNLMNTVLRTQAESLQNSFNQLLSPAEKPLHVN